jgi:hypothetical protein
MQKTNRQSAIFITKLMSSKSHFQNVPYSLALRILRICSTAVALDKHLHELGQMLLSRSYKKVVKNAIDKVKLINRSLELTKVAKSTNKSVILALKYHPKLCSVTQIIRKHWRTLTKDFKVLKIFPSPPLVAYRQPPNLKSVLFRA